MLEEGRTKAERKKEGGTLLDELMMSSRELREEEVEQHPEIDKTTDTLVRMLNQPRLCLL